MNTTVCFPDSEQSKMPFVVCFDVSKASLSWYHEESSPRAGAGTLDYTNEAVLAWLLATRKAVAPRPLRIVCESTSGYHQRLLRLARAAGCSTALVSGEQVKQLQIVENNDTGKSDWKDPRTIMLLVRLGKTLTDRVLEEEWAALRELDAEYTRIESASTCAKNRIQMLLIHLFPDLSFKRDWLFDGKAARVVLELYGFDPFALVADTRAAQRLRARKLLPRTIERLLRDAREAVKQPSSALWREVRVRQLRDNYQDLFLAQERRGRVREGMTDLLERLRKRGKVQLGPIAGVIGPFLLARILSQTGPLSDFGSIRQLWRYAGMNLRPKQSGTVRGKERQAKRGRARLRHVLGQAVLKLVTKNGLYGEYYHEKKRLGMPGPVAMTAVARKFLKLLFGLERSRQPFDRTRVFTCESGHTRVA